MSHFPKDNVAKLPAYGVSVRCPHCRHVGVATGYVDILDVSWTTAERRGTTPIQHQWNAGVRRCPNRECQGLLFVVLKGKALVEAFPPEHIDFDSADLPPEILATLEEAVRCHAAGAYRAATLMVRRLLEELCANRNATGSDLKKRLQALSQTIVVPQDLLTAADELRILGNDAAHVEAKIYDDIGKDEADLAIELAKELLKAVYQYASLLGRLRNLKRQIVDPT